MVSSAQSDKPMKDFELHLKEWATAKLLDSGQLEYPGNLQWDAIRGDAGFRRYFRVQTPSEKLLAVYAPPATENNQAFVDIDRYLIERGVSVPNIFEYQSENGFMLIEDFGEGLLYTGLSKDNAPARYEKAIEVLLQIQALPVNNEIFPEYSREVLLREMSLFQEWFIKQNLGHDLSENESALIENAFEFILQSNLSQPKVIVHRDYHSRNLVQREGEVPGIIDFQDAVIGPITYDVVSLYRDCYVEWPDVKVEAWAFEYFALAKEKGLISSEVDEKTFIQWFDLMGLQRHIKVLGIFSRLFIRDGKHAYLKDLPLVDRYVRRIAGKYEKLSEFIGWYEEVLAPLIQQKAWAN